MDVVIQYSLKDQNDTLQELTEIIKVDSKHDGKTVGELRKDFALKHALFEEQFRFVNSDDGKILHDSDSLKSLVKSPDGSVNPESESDSADDENSEGRKSELDSVERDNDINEKGSYNSSREERNSFDKRIDDLMKVIEGIVGQSGRFDLAKTRNEVVNVLEMGGSIGGPSSIGDGSSQRRPRLRIRVEEGYPVFLYSENDGVKFLACVATDTVQETKERFAKLFDCPVNDFQIHKEEETRLINDGTDTLGEIGMEEGRSFKAWREGNKELITIFGFSVCAKIPVDFTKSIHYLNKTVQSIAPDLAGLRLKFWYNGDCLPYEVGQSPDDGIPLGRLILGSHFLRVMIEFDPTLDISLDKGPDMVVRRPTRDKPIVKKIRRRPDGSGYSPVSDEETEQSNNSSNVNRERRGEYPKEYKGKRIIRLHVNKRALRPFSLLVECQLVENLFTPPENGAGHESPITIHNLTPNMRLHELREEIARKSGEKWQHQILFSDGEMLKPSDDYKTLRELGLNDSKVLYKEPCINVKINIPKKETITVRVAGKSTTFERLASLLENEKEVELNRGEIRFMFNGIMTFPKCAFSEYGIKDGDEFDLVRPLRVRLWHKCYAYDKDVYPYDNLSDLLVWISKKTRIEKVQLFMTWAMGEPIDIKSRTIEGCGFSEDRWEVQVFDRWKLPERLKDKASEDTYHNFIPSDETGSDIDDEDDDEDDEDM